VGASKRQGTKTRQENSLLLLILLCFHCYRSLPHTTHMAATFPLGS